MKNHFFGIVIFLVRAKSALRHVSLEATKAFRWLFTSKEYTNYTYNLTALNVRYMAHGLAVACNTSPDKIMQYINELLNDEDLRSHLKQSAMASNKPGTDLEPRYARRIGWYAIVRSIKPAVIVETGVDKGLGACILASALLKNKAEGYHGCYYGTDINSHAGALFQGIYKNAGVILYGDSLESLKKLNTQIDLFINDSDHSLDYEAMEFEAIKNNLSPKAIIIGDNSHFSDRLLNFSECTSRNFLYFQEQPIDHWYPGAGMGISYPQLNN